MANTENKITKAVVLTEIKALARGEEIVGVTVDDIIAYCDTTLAQIAAKNEKAKAKAAENRAASDALTDKIASLLTDEAQTAEDIVDAIGDESVTKAKVVARMTKLVNAGTVIKETVKINKTTKTVYKLA